MRPLLPRMGSTTSPHSLMSLITTNTATLKALPEFAFIPIVNQSTGSGLVLAHGLAISSAAEGGNSFHYLEGCFHLLTPYSQTFTEGFPGTTLSTGMEDYYDVSCAIG